MSTSKDYACDVIDKKSEMGMDKKKRRIFCEWDYGEMLME